MRRWLPIAVFATGLAVPSGVWAQESARWEGRVFVNLNAGVQTGSPDLAFEHATTLFEETAKASLDVPGKPGRTFDIGGGVRLVQNFGVGVTYARYDKRRSAQLSATIPSPFFFNEFASVTKELPLRRQEDAIHLQAIYRIPVTQKLQFGLMGGPTHFRCRDDVVSRFALTGLIAQDLDWSVDFKEIVQTVDDDSVWGFNLGADVVYLMTKYVGVTAMVRYGRASHKTVNAFTSTDRLFDDGVWGGGRPSGSLTNDHGGLQWNGGLTFRF